MLRTVALQIDVAVGNNTTLPPYVREAAQAFTNAIRKYITEELENVNAAKPAGK